jgi:hypothetical protein
VDAVSCQSECNGRKHCDERLAFAGLHLGNRAARQRQTAQQLDIVEIDLEQPTRGLGNKPKRLNDKVAFRDATTLGNANAKFRSSLGECRVFKCLKA